MEVEWRDVGTICGAWTVISLSDLGRRWRKTAAVATVEVGDLLFGEPKHSAQLKLLFEGKSTCIECRGGLMWCEKKILFGASVVRKENMGSS